MGRGLEVNHRFLSGLIRAARDSSQDDLLPSSAYSARSERIGKHFATDRYLSRGGTVDAAVPPRLACTTSGIALTTVGC